MKKIIALLLIVVLMFAFATSCGKSSDRAQEPETKSEKVKKTNQDDNEEDIIKVENWKELYIKFLSENEHGINLDPIYLNYLALYDLNFDGTPELIVSDGAASAGYTVGVFQIIDGKVECVVGFAANCYGKEHNYSVQNRDDYVLYSSLEDDWITLRKNRKTGEKKYFMVSFNGDAECSFGSLVSICADDKDSSRLKVTNEFEYEEFWETPEDSVYKILGRNVEKDIYDIELEDFYTLWQDTETMNYAMVPDDRNYGVLSKTISLSLEEDALMEYFETYNK